MTPEKFESRFEHTGWKTLPNGSIRGVPFCGMTPLAPEVALQEAEAALTLGRFAELMREWNGSFSVAVWHNGQIGLAVDRTRTIPIFFAQEEARLIVSDSAEWIRVRLGNPPLDPVRKAEFLLAGLVFNDGTLCRDIFQIQAGEAVVGSCPHGLGDWRLLGVRYRLFRPDGSGEGSFEEWITQYDQVLVNCFERAIKVIRNRPVLVPLSGGYDSRLLLLMLKRLGVKNVAAYTYGRKVTETGRSQEVAAALNVPWRLCDYSAAEWRRAAKDHDVWGFVRKASNLSANAILQEWLAIQQHIEQGFAGPETVVMTGYSADFPAGSFYSSFGERGRNALCSREALENTLWRNRLNNWRMDFFPREVLEGVSRELIKSMGDADVPGGWLGAFETWTQSEWVSKPIANAIRAADMNGCDWCLPFFDDEFLAFWERVPGAYRLGERLHCEYTDRLYSALTGTVPPVRHKTDKYGEPKAATVWMAARESVREALMRIYESPFGGSFRKRRQHKKASAAYRDNPLGVSALISESEFVSIAESGKAYNNWRAVKYLELVE